MQDLLKTDKATLERAERVRKRLEGRRVILASASPRRKELLSCMAGEFEIIPSDADETLPDYIPAKMASEYLARLKCLAIAEKYPDAVVIGADTTVVVDDVIFGKPANKKQAVKMLNALSGRLHSVISGIAVSCGGRTKSSSDVTLVGFKELGSRAVNEYIATGAPFDKAGGYGIQDFTNGEVYIESGSYSNVVGLPVEELTLLVEAFLSTEDQPHGSVFKEKE
ncbi:Maf family protein [Ruminococcus sp. NK3A76]|uniref:Maf family protein n=1 Tax=Ruminococcus sp. NK3A76 TaxID=877411 RepID=UPI00068B26CD|nr:Maf family protein [Ruminococcus sp. NK3A76]